MPRLLLSAGAAFAVLTTAAGPAPVTRVSKPFSGAKVNKGTVTMVVDAGKTVLTLSDDFEVPGTPDPHWQIVDAKGNVFLLQGPPATGAKATQPTTPPR